MSTIAAPIEQESKISQLVQKILTNKFVGFFTNDRRVVEIEWGYHEIENPKVIRTYNESVVIEDTENQQRFVVTENQIIITVNTESSEGGELPF